MGKTDGIKPASRLREVLRRYGLKQKDFARMVGYTQHEISMVCCGRRGVSSKLAMRACKRLPGLRIEYLLGMDGYMTNDDCSIASIGGLDEYMSRFREARRKAFTAAILHDNWEAVKEYCWQYDIPIPEDERIMKAGIYKAAQDCTDLPPDVAALAYTKCLELGMSPMIR